YHLALRRSNQGARLQPLEQPGRGEAERVAVEQGHVVADQKNADDDQEHAAEGVNGLNVAADFLREFKKRVDRQRAQEKRQGEARRVAREQQRAAADFARRAREGEGGAEDRPATGRPRHRERDSDQNRAQVARRFVLEVELQVAIERGDLESADEIEPHEQDQDAARHANQIAVVEEQRAQQARRGAERDEDQGKTGDERRRVENHPRAHAGAGLAAAHLLQRNAGNKGKVRGDQRQNAGREKGKNSRRKGDEDVDVGHRLPSVRSLISRRALLPYQSAGPQPRASPSPFGPMI